MTLNTTLMYQQIPKCPSQISSSLLGKTMLNSVYIGKVYLYMSKAVAFFLPTSETNLTVSKNI